MDPTFPDLEEQDDMVHGVSVVWLPVNDVGSAVDFYSQALGLSVENQQDEWAELKAGDLRIGLNGTESPSGDGGAVIAFHAQEGIDATVEELTRKGVEFADGISEHPWGKIAPFKDPDGNDLQLYEPPA